MEARVGRIVDDADPRVRSRVERGGSAVRGWRREGRTGKLVGRVQDRETVEEGGVGRRGRLWRRVGRPEDGDGGGDDGGAAVWRRRRRLEDRGIAMTAEKNPWPGQGVAAVVAAAAVVARRHAAAAVVGLLPQPSLSSHLRGRSLISFFK